MKEIATQAPRTNCRTEQDKWKSELESEALWRERVEGAVRGERGCLAWEIYYYWRAVTYFPIYPIFPHSPLQKHHHCLLLIQRDPRFIPDVRGNFRCTVWLQGTA